MADADIVKHESNSDSGVGIAGGDLHDIDEGIACIELSRKDSTVKIPGFPSKIPPEYTGLQCPSNWEACHSKFGENGYRQFLEKHNRPQNIALRDICFKLLLGSLYCYEGEQERALEVFTLCEELVHAKSGELLFKDILPGILYMINASRCILHFRMGKLDMAKNVHSSLVPIKDLSNESQAFVWAVKAFVLNEFGPELKQLALKYADLAIELDPDELGHRRGAWYCLAGKIRYRIRYINGQNEVPSQEEQQNFEDSISKNPFPIHYSWLADCYRDSGLNMCRNKLYKGYDMLEKSRMLYKKSLHLEECNIDVIRRCGMGLMRLPMKHQDINLAEHCLKQCVEKDPEHVEIFMHLGNIEEWFKKDEAAALAYFKEGYARGNESCGVKCIKMRYQLERTYNPLDDCDRYISTIQKKQLWGPHAERIVLYYGVKGEYFLQVKHDLLAAAQSWEKAFEAFPGSRYLKKYLCIFCDHKIEWNLYKKLHEEVKKALNSQSLCVDNAEYLRTLIKKYEEYM